MSLTYHDLDITILITLGNKAAVALNQKNELLVIQEQRFDEHAVINLGAFTKARANTLCENIQSLAIHVE